MDEAQKAFKLLFSPNDSICVGDQYTTSVVKQPIEVLAPFYVINPIDHSLDRSKEPSGAIRAFKAPGRRADLNVTKFQNFLFEMDNTPLELQLQYIRSCGIPWAAIVFSGSKSYHAILSLETPLAAPAHTTEGIDNYKQVWKQLANVITKRLSQPLTLLDQSTSNPSRLSRMPGYMRDGVKQDLVELGRLCSTDILQQLLAESPAAKKIVYNPKTEAVSETEESLKLYIPAELNARLKFPSTWCQGANGNYPLLLKNILWLIDSTGATRNVVVKFLEKYTFPTLVKKGYPLEKCYKAVEHAFNIKNG